MSRIAALLPREYMVRKTREIIRELRLDIGIVKHIKTMDAVMEARDILNQGVKIIIARGYQAALIKKYTNIPVSEIRLTGQEIALMIRDAKRLMDKEQPHIAFITFENMAPDISYMESIFDVRLSLYYLNADDDSIEKVEEAIKDGCDVIVGGDSVREVLEDYPIPFLLLTSKEDSIRNALERAVMMDKAMETEKSSHAQLSTIMDTTFSGIVEINRDHEVIVVNRFVERMLSKKADEVTGHRLEEIIPSVSAELIQSLLDGKRDQFSTSVSMNNLVYIICAAPIQYDNNVTGVILSFNQMKGQTDRGDEGWKENYLSGYTAKADFSQLNTKSSVYKNTIILAKNYALSKSPVLIYGETGTEKEYLAQCIHNNSVRRNGPFLAVNCNGMEEEQQISLLFGNKSESGVLKRGALELAHNGTVLIRDIDNMTMAVQYRLYRMLQYKMFMRNDLEATKAFDTRIIATCKRNLLYAVKEGTFSDELYYLLNSLTLFIPPVRDRQEDAKMMIGQMLRDYNNAYSKMIQITDRGYDVLVHYQWPGNNLQLMKFMERIVLTAEKRRVDEDDIRLLLNNMYPEIYVKDEQKQLVVYREPEAEKIMDMLEECKGNKALTAQKLGMSTTTLWRKMKKYGISGKYRL